MPKEASMGFRGQSACPEFELPGTMGLWPEFECAAAIASTLKWTPGDIAVENPLGSLGARRSTRMPMIS
eukprot:14848827-Heterocapsa_arctica.AAC.1